MKIRVVLLTAAAIVISIEASESGFDVVCRRSAIFPPQPEVKGAAGVEPAIHSVVWSEWLKSWIGFGTSK